mmetsp:Transcript_22241/g.60024  ORF Transcript_22241/g.60024 Transcript_22241/m.60024 type:complete len:330 (+) Transcript_22241:1786-2775(+)
MKQSSAVCGSWPSAWRRVARRLQSGARSSSAAYVLRMARVSRHCARLVPSTRSSKEWCTTAESTRMKGAGWAARRLSRALHHRSGPPDAARRRASAMCPFSAHICTASSKDPRTTARRRAASSWGSMDAGGAGGGSGLAWAAAAAAVPLPSDAGAPSATARAASDCAASSSSSGAAAALAGGADGASATPSSSMWRYLISSWRASSAESTDRSPHTALSLSRPAPSAAFILASHSSCVRFASSAAWSSVARAATLASVTTCARCTAGRVAMPPCGPGAGAAKETSCPPNPKEAPHGGLSHLGARWRLGGASAPGPPVQAPAGGAQSVRE